ncbi:glucosyltransferase [Enterococcus lactis]|uniref:glucosyltransferase n=1 Tax=Enterococcus lactis TaxID=357441 RepID=UPI0022DF69CC|nr:glucosyltransferase [Enterococcus lactis]
MLNTLKPLIDQLKKKHTYFILGIAVLFTIIRLYLYSKAIYGTDMSATYDDQLLIHYAQNILDGKWLGEYTTTTLSKGISYSLFLVLAHKLHLSYAVLFGMFSILASILVALAFKPIVKNKYLLLSIYFYFLFSPINFTHEYSTRTYRNALVIPAVEIIIACLLAIYYRKYSSRRKLLPWFLGLAVSFPFFWFIREDSIWLLPFTVVALGISFVQILLGQDFSFEEAKKLKERPFLLSKQEWLKLSLFLLPLVGFSIVYQWIEYKNETTYGIATINDRSSGEFGRLMKQLIRIDDETNLNKENSEIWVSHAALNKALDASPTFHTVSTRIDELYTTHAWTQGGKVKELPGDIIFWALRDVVSESGYYQNNAKETNDFWKKVNQELEEAYQKGTIKKKKEFYLMGSGDGKTMNDLPIVFAFLKSGYAYAWRYKDFHQGGNYSFGTQEQVEQAQELLNLPLMDNWIDSSDPRTPDFQLTKTAKVANVMIKIYQVLAIPVLIASIAGILLMILGTVFAKADRVYYSSSLIVVIGLILTQLVFLFGVSWFCSYAPEKKDYFLSVYTGAGVPLTQFIVVTSMLVFSKLNLKKALSSK